MGETVQFRCNGSSASGYLALPPGGKGAGVLVIQEWWGLDSGIKATTERLGAAGFVALAPDLYHGELAGHDETDKAGKLMQSLGPHNALGTFDEKLAAQIWPEVISYLKGALGGSSTTRSSS